MADSVEDVGLDTAILNPLQLSDQEWRVLIEIEQRLEEVKTRISKESANGKRCEAQKDFEPHPVARAETRRQRVLLLDGARGTGKTSFLLTLINRWNRAAGLSETEPWDIDEQTRTDVAGRGFELLTAPTNVIVIRNLDFDPLPPKMPLVAGIVQAWRPLAQFYDYETFGGDELCEADGGRRLMDSWHSLFRVAAAGWSELPRSKGLIEQVLDREEQVRDWQHFREQWLSFVDAVVRTGICTKTQVPLKNPPVFVIVIDDVDLQVERIRELLPALRLLVHDNVFFLIAAHRRHMIEMLKLDFLGQQRRVAEMTGWGGADLKAAVADDWWASELAHASFEKVFPTRNRWRLEHLALRQLLNYPGRGSGGPATFHAVLNGLNANERNAAEFDDDTDAPRVAGDAVCRLAEGATKAFLTLPALSYRSAQQLWQTVSDTSGAVSGSSRERAAKVVARLVSSDADEPARVLPDQACTIQVPTAGEIAAFYRPGVVDHGGTDDVVVTARPDFVHVSPKGVITAMSEENARFFTAGLIAKTLQELKFGVDAGALSWETRLTLAWTDWPTLNATFAWPWHTHPRPDELLVRTAEWSDYLKKIAGVDEKENIRERHAYAWIYYEWVNFCTRKGLRVVVPSGVVPTELAEETRFPWDTLLKLVKAGRVDDEQKRWRHWMLPLMARPELGLPRAVQEKLIEGIVSGVVLTSLRVQRRRLATNAIAVASMRSGRNVGAVPGDDVIEDILWTIELRHREVNRGRSSPWSRLVKDSARRSNKGRVE